MPKTKGSLTFRGHHAEENVQGSARWRMLVVAAVRADLRRRYNGEYAEHNASAAPIHVTTTFFTATDPIMPSAGDLDKLVRNVLDACSLNRKEPAKGAGAYADDRQVVILNAVELLADELVGPGLLLTVTVVSDTQLWHIRQAAIAARGLVLLGAGSGS